MRKILFVYSVKKKKGKKMNFKIGDLVRFPSDSQFAGEIGVVVQISESDDISDDIFHIYVGSQNLAYKYNQTEVEDFEKIDDIFHINTTKQKLKNLKKSIDADEPPNSI